MKSVSQERNEAPEVIRTSWLVLRNYRLSDAEDIYDCYARDKEVTRYLTWRPHQSLEETRTFVKGRISAWSKGDDFTWAVTTSEGKLIGGICLCVDDCKAEFGFVLGKPFWGNGYAAESLQAAVQWAFQQPSIARVWGVCDVENHSSVRVMEKCGLVKEGVLRKWLLFPQVSAIPRDCLCYSITSEQIATEAEMKRRQG